MAKPQQEVYFVFMNFDPVYERLRADRSVYLAQKYNGLHLRVQYMCAVLMDGLLGWVQDEAGVGDAGRVPEPEARQAPRQAPPARHLLEEVLARHRRRIRRRDHRRSGHRPTYNLTCMDVHGSIICTVHETSLTPLMAYMIG